MIESTAGIAIVIAIAALFVFLGALFLCGRGGRLIAGYNTMSATEKAKVNMKAVLKFVGRMMLVYAALLTLMLFATEQWQMTTLIALFFLLVIDAVVFAIASPRFKKQKNRE